MEIKRSLVLGFAMIGGVSLMLGIFLSSRRTQYLDCDYGLLPLFFFCMAARIIYTTSSKRPNRLTVTEPKGNKI